MSLSKLTISSLRNLTHVELMPSPQFNVIYGENGSGKTSILEAIYLLGLAKSFRSHINSRLVQLNHERLIVHGLLKDGQHSLGVEKSIQGKTIIRIDQQTVNSPTNLAELLPVQLFSPNSYRLLEDGPKERRQFLDWGLFHVEPGFLKCWQNYQVALKQRNNALRSMRPRREIQSWDQQLVYYGEALNELRKNYIDLLIPVFQLLFAELLEYQPVTLKYYQGWSQEINFSQALERDFASDVKQMLTRSGPHRADLRFWISDNKQMAQDVLSRGQQKLLVCALKLAQGLLLKERTARTCVYLLDDLAAELDLVRRKHVARVLLDLDAQVFVTSVERNALPEINELPLTQLFHVERGCLLAG
ncbi:MAG: DNA replication/repair protein RecF [Gammaproteobacteria bacterium]